MSSETWQRVAYVNWKSLMKRAGFTEDEIARAKTPRADFEDRARYHNLGPSALMADADGGFYTNGDAPNPYRLAGLSNLPSSPTPLVDQYLPTFAFTTEERAKVEEMLRKGLRG